MDSFKSYKVSRPQGDIKQVECSAGIYLQGIVETQHGYVCVYSEPKYNDDPGHTRLDFIFKGRRYIREQQRGLTERRLVTEATRFATFVATSPK